LNFDDFPIGAKKGQTEIRSLSIEMFLKISIAFRKVNVAGLMRSTVSSSDP